MSKSTAVALAAARGEGSAPVAMSAAKIRNLARANVRPAWGRTDSPLSGKWYAHGKYAGLYYFFSRLFVYLNCQNYV